MAPDVLAGLALSAAVFLIPALVALLRAKREDIPAVVRALGRWLR